MKTKTYRYVVIFEQAEDGGWAGYVPDLPVILCGARTRQQVEKDVRKGIQMYIEDLKGQGKAIPAPSMELVSIEVAV